MTDQTPRTYWRCPSCEGRDPDCVTCGGTGNVATDQTPRTERIHPDAALADIIDPEGTYPDAPPLRELSEESKRIIAADLNAFGITSPAIEATLGQTPRTEAGRPPLDPATKHDDDTYMAGLIRGRELEREAAAARTEALDVGREVLCPYCSQWFAILAGAPE